MRRCEKSQKSLIPKTYEELTPGTSAHFHALDAWSAEVEGVKDKLEALSDEEFEIAYNAVINEAQPPGKTLLPLLKNTIASRP